MVVDPWVIALGLVAALVISSAVAVVRYLRPTFVVATGGTGADGPFEKAELIGDELRDWLTAHYARTVPVLRVWQRRAWLYGAAHFYAVGWTVLISLSLPFLIPYVSDSDGSRVFVQSLSVFGAVVFGLHRTFKAEENYGKYRLHESSVYSLVRKLVDDPDQLGATDAERRRRYLVEIERIRERARNDEINNLPSPSSPPPIGSMVVASIPVQPEPHRRELAGYRSRIENLMPGAE
ncbi:MAG: hypothetical protein JO285_04520 [Kutzneria sp.]|nr:hypothetical protein [Kutzneria sp.]